MFSEYDKIFEQQQEKMNQSSALCVHYRCDMG